MSSFIVHVDGKPVRIDELMLPDEKKPAPRYSVEELIDLATTPGLGKTVAELDPFRGGLLT